MLAYLCDDELRERYNSQGCNYWDTYLEAICLQLGCFGKAVKLDGLERELASHNLRALMLSADTSKCLSTVARRNIARWVARGGLLIGFGARALDEVFGNEFVSALPAPATVYTLAGYCTFLHHPLTHGIRSFLFQEQKTPLFSQLLLVKPIASTVIGWLYGNDHQYLGGPAITWHKYGQGCAVFFAFNLPQTLWIMHQGRPLYDAPQQVAPALSILGHQSRKVPYADELVMLIQNILASHDIFPMIYPLPPAGTQVPEALLFWGGDCCAGTAADFLKASQWMKRLGLPYHFNAYPRRDGVGSFNLSRRVVKALQQNKHEISLHYRFDDKHPLTAEEVRHQTCNFRRQYGFLPICTVMHGMRWYGWTETAQWLSAAGVRADNSFGPGIFPPIDSFGNGPCFGFNSGTAYPFFFYADYRQGNRRLDLLEEPIVCYELGHRCSVPPFTDRTSLVVDELWRAVDLAVQYHWTMNMFYHPVYVATNPACRTAITALLNYIKERGYQIMHMAPDQLNQWWRTRANAQVLVKQRRRRFLELECRCGWAEGMVIKIPLCTKVKRVQCAQRKPPFYTKVEYGRPWLYIVVPGGRQNLKISFED